MIEVTRKRWFSIGTAGILSLAVLAGCSTTSTTTEKTSTDQQKAAEPPSLQTLSYWVPLASNVAATLKSFGDMTVYQELQKKTGVTVTFQHPPVGQEKDQFNLMITGNKLPDVIEYGWTGYPGGPEKAIKDGKIIKLNDIIAKNAPNLKKILDTNPEWKKMIVTDDGSIYGFPFLRGDDYLLVSNGIALRKDWLDKLNLKMPETLDDWHNVLTAIKKTDLNGNGKADEIPLLISKGDMTGSIPFLGSFGVNYEFYQVNGKVSYGPTQPEYKQFLTLMNQWYKEGLLDPDFAVTDNKVKDAKITGNQLFATTMSTGSGIGNYTTLVGNKIPGFKLVASPFPVVKAGDKRMWNAKTYNYSGGIAAAITTSNTNPEGTAKWLDFAYSEEGKMLFNFGVEDVSYKNVNGYPTYTDSIMKPKDTSVAFAMARHVRANFNGPFVQDKRYMEQYAALPEQKDSIKIWSDATNERRMPQVTPTASESSKFASAMNDINTYKDEMFNKFIMGAEPLDNFDKYVKTIEGMGLQEAIKIQQAALERYNKR
ncbi:extracellular solute-binding protein [Bacillus sp. 3255]|uniref:extracellular solute-binding protein n=1 Tax=Bacillus sp. 3255 TaxID=2817904 RepID=UPI002861B263|nr:extracellular solute-binding protein [Bacillus sp. 3255]MDR6879368.1 putative aldouronate transport system substrate-binding protein [Bacillus sp. 3255]